MQPGCGLLHAAGVAEYHPRGLRMVTVSVQGISGRGAAVVSCHAYCFINPEVLDCSTKNIQPNTKLQRKQFKCYMYGIVLEAQIAYILLLPESVSAQTKHIYP